jgi:uncharacterized iron-regulated membrane protein
MSEKSKEIQAAAAKQPLVKRALSAHSFLGLAISAILYVVCLSGTISVFKEQLESIEQQGEPVVSVLPLDAMDKAAKAIMAIDPATKHLYIHIPTSENQRALVETDNKEYYLNKAGDLVVEANRPWVSFLIDLHYYLNLPRAFGMYVVSAFGVFLFAMSISGFVAHPNIFKDAFSFRRGRSEQIAKVDLHNRLSVWTAPFHISNSLTGAMIGLATLSALTVGTLKYDGDYAAVFEPVFGAEPAPNLAQAPVANISGALEYMKQNYPDKPPLYVILHDPGTKGQYLQIMALHPKRLIYAEKYNFTGEGVFIDTVSSADGTAGQQVADSVYRIHFGYFGGFPVRIAFGIFGICLLVIISAGMRIYFLKRRARGQGSVALEAAWSGVVWGVPMMVLLCLLVSILWPGSGSALSSVFWLGTSICIIVNATVQQRRSVR